MTREIHIGNDIRNYILSINVSFREVAKQYNMSEAGFRRKMGTSSFGTVQDLIKICLLLKHDFVSPIVQHLRDNGIEIESMKKLSNYEILENKIESLSEDVTLYKSLLKKNLKN